MPYMLCDLHGLGGVRGFRDISHYCAKEFSHHYGTVSAIYTVKVNSVIVYAINKYLATSSEGISDSGIATNGRSAVVIRWKILCFILVMVDDIPEDGRGKNIGEKNRNNDTSERDDDAPAGVIHFTAPKRTQIK